MFGAEPLCHVSGVSGSHCGRPPFYHLLKRFIFGAPLTVFT